MKIKPLFFCVAFIVNIDHLSAQTGIGTTTPDASARLEVNSTNKGFLPPRIALTALNSMVGNESSNWFINFQYGNSRQQSKSCNTRLLLLGWCERKMGSIRREGR